MNNIDKGPAGAKTFTLRTGSFLKFNNYLVKIHMLIGPLQLASRDQNSTKNIVSYEL